MVVNFNFSSVHYLLRELAFLISVSHQNMRVVSSVFYPADDRKEREAREDSIKSAHALAELSGKLFSEMKCGHIDDASARLRHWANHPPNEWSELNTRSRALRDAIETELKEYLHYQYPKQKGQKFLSWKTDWKAALEAFSDITNDVFSATDCYALGHYTASVFHSMRVAEHGLRALAKERKIELPRKKQLEWATWQEIIRALDGEITLIGSKRAGRTKDAALDFYSGARADLNGFKDEYRNVVMHVRATYDEVQALRALTKVQAFMERLAAKIDHTHQRIKWGRF